MWPDLTAKDPDFGIVLPDGDVDRRSNGAVEGELRRGRESRRCRIDLDVLMVRDAVDGDVELLGMIKEAADPRELAAGRTMKRVRVGPEQHGTAGCPIWPELNCQIVQDGEVGGRLCACVLVVLFIAKLETLYSRVYSRVAADLCEPTSRCEHE